MKRFLVLLLFLLTGSSVLASDFAKIPYKNLKDGESLTISDETFDWTNKFSKKKTPFYITKFDTIDLGTEFYTPEFEPLFATGTNYEFLRDGHLIGYSNDDLKFYELTLSEGNTLERRVLSEDEIRELFPQFMFVRLSEFTNTTNSIKIRKEEKEDLYVMLINDTEQTFKDYSITSGDSKIVYYPLRGLLRIKKRGMLHFAPENKSQKGLPWFVLLVR